jgi:hypothetical protein
MEDKEIRFWTSVNKIPNNLPDETKWPEIVSDYHERMRIAKIDGIQKEKDALEDIIKRLEVSDLNKMIEEGLPLSILMLCDIGDADFLVSRKWNEPLCDINDIFKYQDEAIERDQHYKMLDISNSDDKYEEYLDYLMERKVMTGDTMEIDFPTTEITGVVLDSKIDLSNILKTKSNKSIPTKEPKKKKKLSEGDEDDENDIEEIEDDNGDIVRSDDVLLLDDEFDDTFGEIPDNYKPISTEEIQIKDNWNF